MSASPSYPRNPTASSPSSPSQFKLPPLSTIPASSLAFLLCLVFLGILGFFMLIRLPRLLALLCTSSDWYNGFILHHSRANPSARVPQWANRYAKYITSEKGETISDGEMGNAVYQDSIPAMHTLAPSKAGRLRTAKKRYPPHFSSCIKPFRPLLKPFRARVSPGFSFAQFFVLALYFTIVSLAVLYDSNILIDYPRTGWVAVAQLPFVFAFAQKNNVLGAFLGFGYEKLNFLHRFAGKILILAANLHGLHFIYLWTYQGTFWSSILRLNSVGMWGVIVLLCLDSLYLFSTPYFRNKVYNLFFRSHIVAAALLLPALYMHEKRTLPYIYACTGVYAFDWLLRTIKTRVAKAYIRTLPELGITRVEIHGINAGWRAGQHVRLRALTLQMGWLAWAEAHPFTIASVSRSGPDGLVLFCKRAGDWTEKLYDLALTQSRGSTGARLNVVVEGPYGGPCHTVFSSFSSAVLIAGGSGVSYTLAVLEDLVLRDLAYESRVKSITFVWAVSDPAGLAHVLPKLAAIVRQAMYTPLRICVHYTGAPTGKQPLMITQALLSNMAGDVAAKSPKGRTSSSVSGIGAGGLPGGVTLTAGRPDFGQILREAVRETAALGKSDERLSGMVVGVCGPAGMGDQVAKAVSDIDPMRRNQVGGIEICEEVFTW